MLLSWLNLKKLSDTLMKKIYQYATLVLVLLGATSCLDGHNQWPSNQPNPESERIYGDIGGDPLQLNKQYPADDTGEVAERADKIREKLFPN